jgi:hypothetical protein
MMIQRAWPLTWEGRNNSRGHLDLLSDFSPREFLRRLASSAWGVCVVALFSDSTIKNLVVEWLKPRGLLFKASDTRCSGDGYLGGSKCCCVEDFVGGLSHVCKCCHQVLSASAVCSTLITPNWSKQGHEARNPWTRLMLAHWRTPSSCQKSRV